MEEKIVENKMGYAPVNKLLLSMSLPIIVSMLIQALYNIVDSIFVSKISEAAFTAVSLAFPAQNLMIAFATGTGVGINALLSKSLGERNRERASSVARNGIFVTVIHIALFMIAGFFFARNFMESQSSNPVIVDYGVKYLRVCMIGCLGLFGEILFERLLQSTGKTIFTMYTQGTGAIINIILDPCLIFGIGPFPKLGITGAAVATVIGQFIAFGLSVFFNIKYNDDIDFSMKSFRPSKKIIGKIYAIGVPSILMISIGSIMVFLMNKILKTFGDTAQAVLGAYFKFQSFVFMPVFGLNNGMIPILSYNYGAKNRTRMVQTIKWGILYATIIMLVGFAAFQIFPAQLLKLFDASAQMRQMGAVALRIISISFIFAGFCIIVGSAFQALGRGLLSMIVSFTRQLVVLLPVAFFLAKLGNVDYVWAAFPIAEIGSVLCSALFMRRIYLDTIKPLGE